MSSVFCFACGKQLQGTPQFCPDCGTALIQNVQQPQSAQPAYSSPKPRFCPFCGAQVPEGYSFCGDCGRQLPTKGAPVEPVPPTFQSSKPLNLGNVPPASAERNPHEVNINLSQKKAIQRVYSGPAGITRIFGCILGLSAVMVGLFDANNTTLDPTTFAIYILMLSIFAIAFSGVSRSLRRSTNRVLAGGKVMEMNGVPNMNPQVSKEVARFKPLRSKIIDFGGTQFMMPSRCTNLLQSGSLNKLVYAVGDVHPSGFLQNIMFLGINQTNFDKAIRGTMSIAGSGVRSNWSAAKKRRM
ncbi:MAG: zinc ribbon domain-containing protein [Candidatus Bathyarchaeia archaeon]|jgi:predicted nucleic acid-binding Zn ribbon protein